MIRQEFFRVTEVAKIFGVSRFTIYKRVREGALPAFENILGLQGYRRKTLEEILGYELRDAA